MPYKYPRPYMRKLVSMEACSPALAWLRKRNFATLQEAWDVCEHYEWMCWLLQKLAKLDSWWAYPLDDNTEHLRNDLKLLGQDSFQIPDYGATRTLRRKSARAVRTYFPNAPEIV